MKKRNILIILVAVLIVFSLLIIFIKNHYKTIQSGNNSNKSINDLKEYILNLESYNAEISVEITSNKTKNQYHMIQKYVYPNNFYQEVLEPNSVKGLITKYDGVNLSIENTNLQLSKIYENYPYLTENDLCLSDFIENYKHNESATIEETGKSEKFEILEISKLTEKPVSLTIEDKNQKKLVYILYNEIKINSLKKEDILAFMLNMNDKNI